jgi:hypothetical protein
LVTTDYSVSTTACTSGDTNARPVVATVRTVDFETTVCKLYLLFLSADAAQEKEKKVLLPTGVSKSTAHTVDSLYILMTGVNLSSEHKIMHKNENLRKLKKLISPSLINKHSLGI